MIKSIYLYILEIVKTRFEQFVLNFLVSFAPFRIHIICCVFSLVLVLIPSAEYINVVPKFVCLYVVEMMDMNLLNVKKTKC